MNKKNILTAIGFIAVLVIVAIALSYMSAPKTAGYSAETLVGLAQKLASDGVTMYGAAWCPHCQAEKARFGDAFKYVPYVECPDNIQVCIDKGVTGYPTWIAKDGTKYIGEQGIENLARIAGYQLPQ